jgi:hypothetical protein
MQNATSTVALAWIPWINQFGTLMGLPALGGVMNVPTGTTACFGFLGFFASLFPRNWPLAMVILLATASEGLVAKQAHRHRPIISRCAGMGRFIFGTPVKEPDGEMDKRRERPVEWRLMRPIVGIF